MAAIKYMGLVKSHEITNVFQNFCAFVFILSMLGLLTYTHYMSTQPRETKEFLKEMNRIKNRFVRKLQDKLY